MSFGNKNKGFQVSPVFMTLEAATAGEVVFYDTFTDTDGTELIAHEPNIGESWLDFKKPPDLVYVGFFIYSNMVVPSSRTGCLAITENELSINYNVEVNFFPGDYASVAAHPIMFWYDVEHTSNKGYVEAGYNSELSALIFRYFNNGGTFSSETILTIPSIGPVDETYVLLEVRGDNAKLIINEAELSYSRPMVLDGNSAGIRSAAGGTVDAKIDNFKITDLGS